MQVHRDTFRWHRPATTAHRVGVAVIALAVLLCSFGCQSSAEKARHNFEGGRRYFDQHKFAEAEVLFARSLQRDLAKWEPRFYFALCRMETGDLSSAYRELVQVLEAQPSYVPARVAMGEVLFQSGKMDRVREQVVAIQPACCS